MEGERFPVGPANIDRPLRVGVLASGRGSNLQALIDGAASGIMYAKVALVLSDVEDAKCLERARAAGIDCSYLDPGRRGARLKAEAEERYINTLNEAEIDLVCLAGFMRILSPTFVDAFRYRMLNIHPSLLPAFPGLEAQKQALDYGVRYAGCTVHFVDEKVDGGPIIVQAVIPVENDDTFESLAARILEQEHRIYPLAVDLFARGKLMVEGRRVFRVDD